MAQALALGLDVVVTDHHAPRADGALPDAPIVHPAICGYPCPELCATAGSPPGLAAAPESAAAPQGSARDGRALEEDLDLVALATIADVVRLVGENRTLVRRGLRALAGTAKPGLRALMAVARVDPGKLNERSIAFALAPRLNAAGRMHRADAGLELVLTEDPARAVKVAQELDRANYERRQVEMRIRYASRNADRRARRAPRVCPGGRGLARGRDRDRLASRLAESNRRLGRVDRLGRRCGEGSGRSIDAFDLLAGLTACGGHLRRFGGRRAAAGLEIERGRVEEFAAALSAHAERVLEPEDMVAVERVDAVVGGVQQLQGWSSPRSCSRWRRLDAVIPAWRYSSRTPRSVTCARWGKASTFRFHAGVLREQRSRGVAFKDRRAPAGGVEGGGGRSDVHAGGQRVEGRERAAAGASSSAAQHAGEHAAAGWRGGEGASSPIALS